MSPQRLLSAGPASNVPAQHSTSVIQTSLSIREQAKQKQSLSLNFTVNDVANASMNSYVLKYPPF